MNNQTETIAFDSPGLTLDAIIAARAKIEALMPTVHYATNPRAPLANSDGNMACIWIDGPVHLAGFDVPQIVKTLVILHPDNLPEFQQQCRGRCRLVALTQEPTP